MKIAMGFEIGLAFQASVVKMLNLNPVSRKQLKNLDLISFKMSEFIFFRQILWTCWIRPCLLPIYFTIWSNHGLWSIGRNERPDIWHAKCILATFRINYRLVTICWFSSLLVPFWLNEMVRFWVSSHFLGKHGRNGLKFGMLIMYADHLHNWLDYGHGLINFFNFGELLLMKRVKYGLSGYFSENARYEWPGIWHADISDHLQTDHILVSATNFDESSTWWKRAENVFTIVLTMIRRNCYYLGILSQAWNLIMFVNRKMEINVEWGVQAFFPKNISDALHWVLSSFINISTHAALLHRVMLFGSLSFCSSSCFDHK